VERITFYDIDSRPIERRLSRGEKRLYLREIKKDMSCFGKTDARAHLRLDIAGLDAARPVRGVHEEWRSGVRAQCR
jgi:shikimate kinase